MNFLRFLKISLFKATTLLNTFHKPFLFCTYVNIALKFNDGKALTTAIVITFVLIKLPFYDFQVVSYGCAGQLRTYPDLLVPPYSKAAFD